MSSKCCSPRDLRRLLTALAKSGAGIEFEHGETGVLQRVAVVRGAGETPDHLMRLEPEIWSEAVHLGLVAADAAGCWRVSDRGRDFAAAGLGDRRPPRIGGATGAEAAENSRPSRPLENPAESPLGWLRTRRDREGAPLISDAQFDAGERLRSDFERGRLTPRITANWSRLGSGSGSNGTHRAIDLSDGALAARERVDRALHEVGPEMARVLLDVCCHLKGLEQLERESGWPQRSGKVVLTMALSALARHYRIGHDTRARPGAVQHWGTSDYRPTIEGS